MKRRQVVAAVICWKGKILVIRRGSDLQSYPNLLCFAGGRVEEEDVDMKSSIIREMIEELGLNIKSDQIEKMNLVFEGPGFDVHFFKILFDSNHHSSLTLPIREVEEVLWLTSAQIKERFSESIPSLKWFVENCNESI